ncbi:MAG: methyltransferase domain-containing protein, partial [Pseudomonadota bacterium]
LPGGGWYTHIVAPYLKSGGKYIAANLHPDLYKSDEPSRRQRRFAWAGKFTADEEIFGKNASTAFFGGGNPTIDDESVDMVFAIRSFHGWVQRDLVDPVLADFFRMVKPGGTLAIVQHREFEASENEQNGRRGYLKESFVIDAAKRAGFELVARSEVNANPRDTKDHASGVWTLPPVLTNGDRVEYKLIGESDRMTLKFRKPTA